MTNTFSLPCTSASAALGDAAASAPSACHAALRVTTMLRRPGSGRTRVAVAIDYSLQGPLAQFSRGGLVKEFVKKMVADFAANLNARLGVPVGSAAPEPAPVAQVDAGGVFWSWLWGSIRRLFGGK